MSSSSLPRPMTGAPSPGPRAARPQRPRWLPPSWPCPVLCRQPSSPPPAPSRPRSRRPSGPLSELAPRPSWPPRGPCQQPSSPPPGPCRQPSSPPQGPCRQPSSPPQGPCRQPSSPPPELSTQPPLAPVPPDPPDLSPSCSSRDLLVRPSLSQSPPREQEGGSRGVAATSEARQLRTPWLVEGPPSGGASRRRKEGGYRGVAATSRGSRGSAASSRRTLLPAWRPAGEWEDLSGATRVMATRPGSEIFPLLVATRARSVPCSAPSSSGHTASRWPVFIGRVSERGSSPPSPCWRTRSSDGF